MNCDTLTLQLSLNRQTDQPSIAFLKTHHGEDPLNPFYLVIHEPCEKGLRDRAAIPRSHILQYLPRPNRAYQKGVDSSAVGAKSLFYAVE